MIRNSYTVLCIATMILMGLGIIMLCSTGIFAQEAKTDLYHSVKRQSVWMAIGLVAALIAACVDYRFWQRFSWLGYTLAAIGLICCFVPGIRAENSSGGAINGSWRWISSEFLGVGGLRVQPSEFAKIAVLALLAGWFARNIEESKKMVSGFVVPCLIVALPMALILAETDIGTAGLIGVACFAMMFAAGTAWRYLVLMVAAGAGGLFFLIKTMPERALRFTAFLDVEAHKTGDALQAWRSMLAFGTGGLHGVGLGDGRQKMSYLPFAHTDFIFPMIGEELGLIFTLGVVFCFVVIAVCGAFIAACAPDPFGRLLGFGLVVLIVGQAIINIGVTTAVLPTKGIPLPFVSYGGSNLLCCLISIGILLNIARQAKTPDEENSALLAKPGKVTPRL